MFRIMLVRLRFAALPQAQTPHGFTQQVRVPKWLRFRESPTVTGSLTLVGRAQTSRSALSCFPAVSRFSHSLKL